MKANDGDLRIKTQFIYALSKTKQSFGKWGRQASSYVVRTIWRRGEHYSTALPSGIWSWSWELHMPLIFGSERRLAPFFEWETEGREEREESSTPTVYHDDGVVDCLNGVAPAPSDAGGKSLP
jgi:hypothetical protein